MAIPIYLSDNFGEYRGVRHPAPRTLGFACVFIVCVRMCARVCACARALSRIILVVLGSHPCVNYVLYQLDHAHEKPGRIL